MFKTANVYMQINRTTLNIFYLIRKVSSDGTSQEVIIIIYLKLLHSQTTSKIHEANIKLHFI